MRNILIVVIFLFFGVGAMAYLYFSNLNNKNGETDSTLNVVASNASIVFTFENDKGFYDILKGQTVLEEILGKEKSKTFQSIKENLLTNERINKLFDREEFYVGFVPSKNNEIDFILAAQTKQNGLNKSLLKNISGVNVLAVGPYHEITLSDSSKCYLAIKAQNIWVSNNIENLKQIDKKQLVKSEFGNYIIQNKKFSKSALANVYIDYNKIPELLKNILNTNINGEIDIFNKQNSFAAFSYNFASNKLFLNGYTDIKNNDSYYNLFVDEVEQKIEIDQLFLAETANYTVYNVNNYEKWQKKLNTWFEKQNKLKQIDEQFKNIENKYRIDLKRTFSSLVKNQFANFQLKSGEKLGIINISNGDKLAQLLLDLSSFYANEIYILNETNILYNFFGTPFKKFERPFYTIIDNHLVVANNASTIQFFLNGYNNNNLLINTSDYTDFKDQTSNSATILFYIYNKNSNDIFGKNLKPNYYKQYKSGNGFKDYNAFGYQLSSDKGKFMSNVILLKKTTNSAVDTLKN